MITKLKDKLSDDNNNNNNSEQKQYYFRFFDRTTEREATLKVMAYE